MKKIAIIGGGESGVGAAILAARKGYAVFLSDGGSLKDKYRKALADENIAFEEKMHTEEKILDAQEVIKSPGVPDKAPIMEKVRAAGIPVTSEIEFAGRYTNATIIGITGTNGKTTTTGLVHHILSKEGRNVCVAGNIGNSFAMEVANATADYDYYVLELSSFQLDHAQSFRVHVAILTNITPDHLDRYNYDVQEYTNAKFNIIAAQTDEDYFIYCGDDALTVKELEKRNIRSSPLSFSILKTEGQAAYIEHEKLVIKLQNDTTDMFLNDLALQGKHNIYNSMAAGIAARVTDVRKETIRESLADFENIEHRLEFVARVKGMDFINDSKATNVNSAWYALECMASPVIWIAGGVDKGNDYEMLLPLVKQKVKAIICLGVDNAKLLEAFKDSAPTIIETTSMAEAVKAAYYMGKKGDAVLLSPACASFDLFENYEDRGHQFKASVREL